ncbi:hypothetical protein ABW20_dc0103369 [Dactylellina cionopaga]|nr:hypothetical protein ABW20_dc0103369 [Dactylellina cionopaga]
MASGPPQVKVAEPSRKYPGNVGRKFDPDGNPLPFPGNTILSHLSPSSELYASMLVVYENIPNHRLAHLFALLPPSSWHMTIFEGVCDTVRKPGFWPSDLGMDRSLEECNDLFARKLSAFDLQCEPPYLMKAVGWTPTGLGIHVELRTEDENKRLRGLRDRLADTLKIRHRGHETYGLHISMGYRIRFFTEEQTREIDEFLAEQFKGMAKQFELGAPEFCKFNDMFAFYRQFYLQDQKKQRDGKGK